MQMPYQLQTMQNTTIPSSQATPLALINVENELQSILGKSEAQNTRKLRQRHGKIPSRSSSKTHQTCTSKTSQMDNLKAKYSS